MLISTVGKHRRLGAVAAGIVATTLLAGCGSGGDSEELAQTKSEKTAAAEEASNDFKIGPVDKQEFLDAYEQGTKEITTAKVTSDIKAAGMTITADGDLDLSTDPPSAALVTKTEAGNFDVRIVDGDYYLNLGALSQDKFFKIESTQKDVLTKLGVDSSNLNPLDAFNQFAAGVTKVEKVGEEKVDGEDTDKYALTIDTAKVESFAKNPQVADALPETLEYQLWLDDEDRMRQVQFNIENVSEVTMNLSDFGEPVDIKAPAANQLTELPAGLS